MAEELENIITKEADKYIQTEREKMKGVFYSGAEKIFALQVERVKAELKEFYAGHLSALEGGISTEKLLEIRSKI